MRDFEAWGLSCPVTYTPDDHRGQHSVIWEVVRDGKVVVTSDWIRSPVLTEERCIESNYVKPGTWEEILGE